VLLDDTAGMAVARKCLVAELPSLEPGGPREHIYFDPARIRVGIVTCGGLCSSDWPAAALQLTRRLALPMLIGANREGPRWPMLMTCAASRWPCRT
jgi:hypothetical protein